MASKRNETTRKKCQILDKLGSEMAIVIITVIQVAFPWIQHEEMYKLELTVILRIRQEKL